MAGLHDALDWPEVRARAVEERAVALVQAVRGAKGGGGQLEAFLQEYALDTKEGLAMMALAEALLRIPDGETANLLIRDKVAAADWLSRQGDSKDFLGKVAGFGMKLTQKTLEGSFAKLGAPVVREAMVKAMQVMGRQFVLGDDIPQALKNAASYEAKGYRMSYDVLGEGARDFATAQGYFEAYRAAIHTIGEAFAGRAGRKGGMSVKLSALHPRYCYAQKEVCVPEVTERLVALCVLAAGYDIPVTVDAEEAARLDLSVDILCGVMADQRLKGWDGLGLAVQAYQKRALPLIDYLAELAQTHGRKLQVRVVKGAYWDTEIKLAQMGGLPGYPVFTRKCHTDVSWLACAGRLFAHGEWFYPMLATHNAHSVAAVLEMAEGRAFEFQRLHGMGEGLYAQVLKEPGVQVSIYAPVGPHKDLLPYLVRRLLENGANSSFVNQLLDHEQAPEEIVRDPVAISRSAEPCAHPKIVMPSDLFAPERKNSQGLDLNAPLESQDTLDFVEAYRDERKVFWLIDGKRFEVPGDADKVLARCFGSAQAAFSAWDERCADERAEIIERFADLLEEYRDEFMAICGYEGGKTIADARDEVREAVDFCRYYAARARGDFSENGCVMPGYTGEQNVLRLQGRGVFVAISPWNFPLAIFTGQVVAALLAGNCVLAKPASQTRYVAMRAVELMHKAGVPGGVLHFLPGDGAFGGKMVRHKDVAGVVFTGSTVVAKSIQRGLAERERSIVPLIAETGGQNAMILDSSCLPEQAVDDILLSAFGSAGQRCSALRVLYVQEDIAEGFLHLLRGAMETISIGNPTSLSADIGPVIDGRAAGELREHVRYLEGCGRLIGRAAIPDNLSDFDQYFSPVAYEIPDIGVLKGEVFGPVLHVIRFKASEIDDVIAAVNSTGYGLTFGLHSRIAGRQEDIARRVRAGNVYVNRSMIGAVVGVQPFGGMGLSGTGPKAGGPFYLHGFATEKHISANTTAAGGNASLVMLDDGA